MRFFIIFFTIGIFLMSCGKTVNDDVSLFSKWSNGAFDFTNGYFNIPIPVRVYTPQGNWCFVDITFVGDQNTGVFSSVDRGCGLGNNGGPYIKTNTTLTLYGYAKTITLHK